MYLPKPKTAAQLFTQAEIATALDASIVEIAERAGVEWDARRSRPTRGDFWACCPFHGERTASFHVVERAGQAYFKCHGCGARGDTLELYQRLHGVGFRQAVTALKGEAPTSYDPALLEARAQRRREAEARDRAERGKRRTDALAIYEEASPIPGTLGEAYLRSARAIQAPLGRAALRFHPSAPLSPYGPARSRRRPAIVAAIHDADGQQIGTHCTFLASDGRGKAQLDHLPGARLIAGCHVGGSIPLGVVRDAVVIAEGIETAFSAGEACGLPAIAAINAANLRAVVLPNGVRRVVIAPDRDANGAGELAADALAQRLWLEDVSVEVHPPPDTFKDWNDAARAGALHRGSVA